MKRDLAAGIRTGWFGLGAAMAVVLLACSAALGAEVRKFEGHADGVTGVVFFPDGRRAASCGDATDKTVRVWDVETGRELRRFSTDGAGFSALAVSPDGNNVMAAGRDHVLRLWAVAAPAEAAPRRLEGHGDVVNHLAFSPDGKLAASTSWDGTLRLWDVPTGKEARKFEGHQGSVNGVAFSPDGRRLATGGADHTARVWDAATGRELLKFEGHAGWVGDLAFAADGRRFASGASVTDPVARVWDVATGKVLARLEGNAEAVYAVAFSRDGRSVLTGGEDDSVRLFDATTGRPVRKFETQAESNVRAVAFLSDGRRALSAGDELDLRLWDVATGESLARFSGHSQSVGLLAVSPDGGLAASADAHGFVRIWRLPTRAAGAKPRPATRGTAPRQRPAARAPGTGSPRPSTSGSVRETGPCPGRRFRRWTGFEREAKLKLPQSYRDWMTTIGPGELVEEFVLHAPVYPADEKHLWISLEKLDKDHEGVRSLEEKYFRPDGKTYGIIDPDRARRLRPFCTAHTDSRTIGWDPQEITDPERNEYAIYLLERDYTLTRLAPSFRPA